MKPSRINKIGPLWKIDGGDIFLSPFETSPLLEGYSPDKALKPDTPLLVQIKERADKWYKTFPECCDTHKKLKVLPSFNKEDYSYIPDQIVENLKYFSYSLEYFFGSDNWLEKVTEYLDYLTKSFGSPEIGGYLFDMAVKVLIENIKLENGEMSDDDRLFLLEYFEPPPPDNFFEDRDLDVLYLTFQKWLEAMPNIGQFKLYKDKITGKIPMNLFAFEMKYNKYLQTPYMKMRSKKELLELLLKLTEQHLKDLSKQIQAKKIIVIKDKHDLIMAADQRLKLEHSRLFKSDHVEEEIEYLSLIEQWFSAIIKYYKTVSSYLAEDLSEIKAKINKIDDTTTDILSNTDIIRLEFASILKTNKPREWVDRFLGDDYFEKLEDEIEKGIVSKEELLKISSQLQSFFANLENDNIELGKLNEQLDKGDVSVKHKIKLGIPLFLFTKYEAEIELSAKDQIPLTIKGIMKLLFKE